MQIRLSPYNSPFIPAGHGPDVYWIGLEYQTQHHDAHVADWIRCRGPLRSLLPELDECAGEGIKASARRAAYVRQYLTPTKKLIADSSKLLAKKIRSAQV